VPSTSLLYRALIRCGVAPCRRSRASAQSAAGIAGRAECSTPRGLGPREPRSRPDRCCGCTPRPWARTQAEAVLERLRHTHPEWQIVYTYFSPSAVSLASQLPVDLADYSPGIAADVAAALTALGPTALVFSKLDLWPELPTRPPREHCGGNHRRGGERASAAAALARPVLLRPGYRA
jgi:hypothetical protein